MKGSLIDIRCFAPKKNDVPFEPIGPDYDFSWSARVATDGSPICSGEQLDLAGKTSVRFKTPTIIKIGGRPVRVGAGVALRVELLSDESLSLVPWENTKTGASGDHWVLTNVRVVCGAPAERVPDISVPAAPTAAPAKA